MPNPGILRMARLKIFFTALFGLVVIGIALYATEFLSLHPILPFFRTINIYPPVSEINEAKLEADNPKVVNALKRKFLFPPSSKPYNLSDPNIANPSMGQADRIDMILSEMRNGFFIECGALDGETRSNTLFFEIERNWRGLLIEADPKNFDLILEKHRKAYASPTCLAPSSHPTSVKFQQQHNMGHIVGEFYHNSGGPEPGSILEVQCFPLVSYLKALNVTTVDYFSLDVEGAEFDILQSIPWKEVDIKTLSVEFIHNKVNKYFIKDYMKDQGYYVHSEVTHAGWLANDFIFVREDLYL